MDISFACNKCGQSIVVDEAGAGITVDCPTCKKPIYVPSSTALSTKSTPVRIETKSTKPMVVTTPISRAPTPSVTPATAQKQGALHPAIEASLICLVVGVAFGLVCLITIHQNLMAFQIVLFMAMPFLGAAPWCAIYGMCVGHVRHGLLLLAAMCLAHGIFYSAFLNSISSIGGNMIQQMMPR